MHIKKFLSNCIVILASLLWSHHLLAQEQEYKVVKLVGENQFVFPISNQARKGATIYIYNQDKFGAVGVVLACKSKSCLGKVTKPQEDFNYQLGMLVRFTLRPPKQTDGKHGIFGGMGGTLGYSKMAGYLRPINKESHLEVGLELLDTTLGGIKVSGIGVMAGVQFVVSKTSTFEFPTFLNLSYNKSELSFKELDQTGYSLSTTVLSATIGQAIKYKMGERLGLSAGLGISYNTYAKSYFDEGNKIEYQIPFSGIFPVGLFQLSFLL